MPQAKRILPADVYDALELSALAFGGIGWGDVMDEKGAPRCIFGHAQFVAGSPFYRGEPEVSGAIIYAGITSTLSDDAVVLVLGGTAVDFERVPFADWCAALGVVRGE